MTPLEPRDQGAADRHDRRRGEAQDQADSLIVLKGISHIDALSHIGTCRDCRWILFQHFHKVAQQLADEIEVT